MTNEEYQAKMDLVKEFLGEHFDSWVFVGTSKEDDDSFTASAWSGEFNEAIGMVERMKERLRQKMLETDFPDDPSGEDWKQTENA